MLPVFLPVGLVAAMIAAWGMGLPASRAWGQAADPTASSVVHVEDSPATQELIAQALRLAEEGRVDDAAAALHEVSTEHADRLVPGAEQVYQSAVVRVRELLAARPALAEAYRATFTPAAERALQLAVEGGIDEAALRRVERSYGFTAPGLQASLWLAGLELERFEPARALGRLDGVADHPSLDAVKRDHALLTAQARLLAGEAGSAAEAAAGLSLDDDDLAALASLADSLSPGLLDSVARGGHRPSLGDINDLLDAPLWEIGVESPGHLSLEGEFPEVLRRQLQAAGGEAHDLLVAAAGDRFVFNNGDTVQAIDRDSGRSLWRYSGGPALATQATDDPRVRRAMLSLARRGQPEPRGVAVVRDRAITVTGQGVAQMGVRRAVSRTFLSALGLESGTRLWRLSPADVDASLERAEFVGTPVIAGDLVVAAARRSQVSGVQDTFLIGVDWTRGEVVWRRHLSSVVTTRRFASGPPPQLTVHGGRVFAFDNVSVVSCLDARGGLVLWSRVLEGDRQIVERVMATGDGPSPGQLSPPLLIEAGLLVGLTSGDTHAFVLDPRSGSVLRRLEDPAWKVEHARVGIDGDVATVGRVIERFDGATLEPVWTTVLNDARGRNLSPPTTRSVATREHLVVPTPEGLALVRATTGEIVRRVGDVDGGHVTVAEGQLVVGHRGRVSSFLGWSLAVERLTAAIASRPSDPGPALGLAHLSMAVGEQAMLERALDHVVDAAVHAGEPAGAKPVNGGEAVRAEAFAELRRLVEDRPGGDGEAIDAVLARMSLLAETPAERATHLLLEGSRRAEAGDASRAVAAYQSVLAEEPLAASLFESALASRRAGVEARRRLEALLEDRGREAYAAFERRAQEELERLTTGTARAPARLTSLARRYPFAQAAATAMLEAASAYALLDREAQALDAASEAYRLASRGHPDAGRIVATLVKLARDRGDARQAARVLRRAMRRHETLALMDDGEPRDARAWLAALEAQAERAPASRPGWGPPVAEVRRLDAVPVPMADGVEPNHDGNAVVLVRSADRLLRLDAETLSVAWDAGDIPGDVRWIGGGETLLIYSPSASTVWALDAATGKTRWRADAQPLFDGLPTARAAKDEVAPDRQVFLQIVQNRRDRDTPRGPLLAADAGPWVVWALRDGRVLAVRRSDGKLVWRRTLGIDSVTGIHLGEQGLTVRGVSGLGTDAASGAVEVLDPQTGESLTGVIETAHARAPVHAEVVDHAVVIASATEVAAYQLDNGVLRWRTTIAGEAIAGGGWIDAAAAVFLDDKGSALGLDLDSGELRWRAAIGEGMADPVVAADPGGDGVPVLLSTNGVARLDARDGPRWRDAIHLPHERFYTAAVSRQHVVVAGDDGGSLPIFGEVPDSIEAPPRVALFLLERDTGRIGDAYVLDLAPTPLRHELTRMTDRWLLLSNGEQCVAVRGDAATLPPPPPAPLPPAEASSTDPAAPDATPQAATQPEPASPPSVEQTPRPAPSATDSSASPTPPAD